MNILLVGGGKLIYFLSRSFISKGYRVTVINNDRDESTWLARNVKATVVYGAWTDPQILMEAEADTADAVVAITPNDQDNLAVCQLAEMSFHIPRKLALINDPDNENIFIKLGITTVFSPVKILSNLIEQRFSFEGITCLLPVEEGKINITDVVIQDTFPVVGKKLSEIDLPDDSLIAYILRNDTPLVARGGTQLFAGDHVIVITLPENHGKALKTITGEMM
ncbi:MAG: TrkA family potassium uptake protein [Candidatus Latescibacterota bacterium]